MTTDLNPSHSAEPEKTHAEVNVFERAWYGKEKLAVVWWGFGIQFKAVSWAINSRWSYENLYERSSGIAAFMLLATIAIYVVLSVMVWRCAPNTKEKGLWTWVA